MKEGFKWKKYKYEKSKCLFINNLYIYTLRLKDIEFRKK
jgi:hypothetical protein